MSTIEGSEYLLDGYYTYKDPREIVRDDTTYIIQHYQGDHEDEYTMKCDGKVSLFQNGVLKMTYEVDNNGTQIGTFTRFENGRVAFVQDFNDIFDKRDFNRIVNHVKGERMEIYSHATGKLTYHGEFNEQRGKEGWGIQYDEKSGRMLLEGMWKNNKLVEIIRKIEGGSIMTEFKRNGNNTIVSNRIPVYVGGFVYDEEKESFIRNGRGYLIDEETRIATRECEWKDGKEVSGRDLYDGWYTPVSLQATISETRELANLNVQVTELVIQSNCCNDVTEFDLSQFKRLSSLEIGDDCFGSVKTFNIDGLRSLKRLKIGKNSFTEKKNSKGEDASKSFHVLNCEQLQSIEIEPYSFSDYAGGFELKNLPSLQMIKIGSTESKSFNFNWSSFVIRGSDNHDAVLQIYQVSVSFLWEEMCSIHPCTQ